MILNCVVQDTETGEFVCVVVLSIANESTIEKCVLAVKELGKYLQGRDCCVWETISK